MRVGVFRDLSAIRFIRCVTPIPGVSSNAGGAGFTLKQALARCESEVAERTFELHELAPTGVFPVGIAAHLDFARAKEGALQETIETLCLEQIQSEGAVRCVFRFNLAGIAFGISHTSAGYFCIMTTHLGNEPIAAYSARRTLGGTLIKMWEEYRNFRFFKPEGRKLKNYSKAQKLFSAEDLRNLRFQFQPDFSYSPDLSGLQVGSAERSGRTIVYYFETGELKA